MLTQKEIKSVVPSKEFTSDMISWLANHSEKLAKSFEKNCPRARNKFNIVLKNVDGSTRLVVLNAYGQVKFFKGHSDGAYKNVIRWNTARRLGCPIA